MNGNGGADCSRSSHAPSEIHQIGMSYDSIDDVDGETVRRITGAILRDEQETPGAVIGRSRIGIGSEERAHTGDCDCEQKPFHDIFSEGLLW